MRILFFLSLWLLFISAVACPADTSKRTRYDYGDPIQLRIGANYNFGANNIKLDVGIYKANFPFSINTDAWIIMAHGTFLTTEINIYDKFFLGPKIGFEFNLYFIEARINFIDYLDFRGNNCFVFRPEIGGATFFGKFSICYGYNFKLNMTNISMTQPHVVSLTYNFQ